MKFLIALFIFFSGYSQNNITIEYGVEYVEFYKEDELTRNIGQDSKMQLEQHENDKKKAIQGDLTIFTLKINESSSLTDYIDFMDIDDHQSFILLKMATTITPSLRYKNQIYLIKGLLNKKPTYVDFDYNINWKIKEEYKEIMGYKCQLAEAKIEAKIKATKDRFHVKAWFTTEIPVPEGPSIFKGLPGLILGLEKHGRYIYARDIDFPDQLNIEIPNNLYE